MNLTVEEAYKSYESFFEMRLKYASIRSIKSRYKLFIRNHFGDVKIKDIKPIDILKWQQWLNSQNYSYKYLKSIYITFVGILNYSKKYLGTKENVVSKVGFIIQKKELEKNISFWTLKEYKKFIKKVDHKIYKYFFDFLFFTGCRQGEAIALTFNDINKGIVTIKKTKIRGKEKINSPKTKKSNRKIKIDIKLRFEIFKLKRYYNKKYKNFNNDFFVFGGNRYLSESEIARRKNKACELSHVKKIRIHDFRHSHITMLVSNGVPINAVAERVGHKDISTTLNIYAHTTKNDERKIINLLSLKRMLPF